MNQLQYSTTLLKKLDQLRGNRGIAVHAPGPNQSFNNFWVLLLKEDKLKFKTLVSSKMVLRISVYFHATFVYEIPFTFPPPPLTALIMTG